MNSSHKAKTRVLIVDDEPANIKILSNLLAQEKDMAAALMPLEPDLFAAANVAARPPDSLESSPHSVGALPGSNLRS